jgi:2-polyprenyl-6-methoxyphenol hydroxylase-like FAD-dependent oxidoreductase
MPAETLLADLVVDAGGRGSRAPAWLEALGYGRPAEERVTIGVGYTTRLYRRRTDDLPGARYAVALPTPPHQTRMGVLFPVEGARWMVTLGGWLGDHAPGDEAGFLAFARSLPAPDIADVIAGAEPLGEPALHKFPTSLRRRYERLRRVPEGYLVLGDALCSFNPIYGQGMTVAALEALEFNACLRAGQGGLAGLPRRFYRRAARVIEGPWQLAAGGDFAYPEVAGRKAPGTDLLNRYAARVQRAATRDPKVCRALVAVTNLLAPPAALFGPRVLWQVARAGVGAGRRLGARAAVAGGEA